MTETISSVTAAQQQDLAQKVTMAVARKALDALQAEGEAVAAMLDAAAQIGRAPGRGGQFDSAG